MGTLNSSAFIKTFNDFLLSKTPEILRCYDSPRERTHVVIGKPRSTDDCHLGEFIAEKFPNYKYRREDGSVDLSIYLTRDPYKNVLNLWFDHRQKALNVIQPVYYDILIEMENKLEHGYQEMAKLTYYNSGLKVLILWLWKDEVEDREVHPRLVENFRSIIQTTNSVSSENPMNTYLLISIQLVNGKLLPKYSEIVVEDVLSDGKV